MSLPRLRRRSRRRAGFHAAYNTLDVPGFQCRQCRHRHHHHRTGRRRVVGFRRRPGARPGREGHELRVLPVVGKGPVQNVIDVLYLKSIDMGFVVTDVP
jgi:hypothetical protein